MGQMKIICLLFVSLAVLPSQSFYFRNIHRISPSLVVSKRTNAGHVVKFRNAMVMSDDVSSVTSTSADEEKMSRATLKSRLFSLAATVDRGFGAKRTEREEILALIDRLKVMSPYQTPTQGLYDGKQYSGSEDSDYEECLIEGTWKMVYTTALDVLSLAASPFTLLQGIYQVIKRDGELLSFFEVTLTN